MSRLARVLGLGRPNQGRLERFIKRAARSTASRMVLPTLFLLFVMLVVPYARAEKLVRKAQRKKPRIFWGITPILTIKYSSKAIRRLGYKSTTVVYTRTVLDEKDSEWGDYDFVMDDPANSWMVSKGHTGLLGMIVPGLLSIPTFYWAVLKHDIFHMYFVGGILWPFFQSKLEIPLLHLAGKKVIVIPFGDDARIRSEAVKFKAGFCQHCDGVLYTCDEAGARRRVEYFCRYADIVLECAETVGYFPRSDGMWFYPIDNEIWRPVDVDNGDLVRVVHSSNHRVLKGTDLLITAVDELKAEGYNIELVIVEKTPNREAKKIYETADIIADQFYAGAYALFALEGMALGKPVMCYLSDEFLPWHPEWEECPIVNTGPSVTEIKEKIRMLAADELLRRWLGAKGVEYVEKWHGLRAIGEGLDDLYRRIW